LSIVTDAYSKKIMGYYVAGQHEYRKYKALNMAIAEKEQ
jgi:hypothetical protein